MIDEVSMTLVGRPTLPANKLRARSGSR